jgi:hypothetical protein
MQRINGGASRRGNAGAVGIAAKGETPAGGDASVSGPELHKTLKAARFG